MAPDAEFELTSHGDSIQLSPLRRASRTFSVIDGFAALVRQGPGNEPERLALPDAHRDRVNQQINALELAREIIEWKTGVYRQHVQDGNAAGLWDPTSNNNA